jgi:cell division protein FtsW
LAVPIFVLAVGITLLVFVPGIGFEYGGATRWIHLGSVSFQPSEFLKLGVVILSALWLAKYRVHLSEFRYGLLPLIGLLGIAGAIMLAQPDTGTFLVIIAAVVAMYIAAGARLRDLVLLAGAAVAFIGSLAYFRPYIMNRILTFLDPSLDPLGTSYQIQQALIAIGSGGVFGRGFGQSVQKFDYLPEPIGDSIFAVAAEEFGFFGAMVLISLFILFAFRGFRIAARAPDHFGGLLVIGIVILIVSQSFINIASMIGVLPLTGLPLLFVSHGGSALFLALLEVGIVLNVSRYSRAS